MLGYLLVMPVTMNACGLGYFALLRAITRDTCRHVARVGEKFVRIPALRTRIHALPSHPRDRRLFPLMPTSRWQYDFRRK